MEGRHQLAAGQLDLIRQLASVVVGKQFAVVQISTMIDSAELKGSDGVGALLWAGYPGQDGGTAIANVLYSRGPSRPRAAVRDVVLGQLHQSRQDDLTWA